MKRYLSTSEKVRRMINRGYSNRAIVDKLNVKPQVVYNIRYKVNKLRGLGAISTPVPAPDEGIGAPPKRKYVRKAKEGTGINYDPPALQNVTFHEVPEKREGEPVFPQITLIEKPTFWSKLKTFLGKVIFGV